mgnify:CR=1 FL=1|jgi:hypothetical protein
MKNKTYQTILRCIDNVMLRRELQEALEQGWITEEDANAIRRLKVPSGDRRKRLKKAAKQGSLRDRKIQDLQNRSASWSGLR